MPEAFLCEGACTPVGRFGGALAAVRADHMPALAIREAVARAGVPPEAIEDCVMGCANQAGEDNRDVARTATLLAGLPETAPGPTVNRLCGSGLNAIGDLARAIRAGDFNVIERNEAFAARAPAVTREPGSADDAEHVDPNGGAIALGHPPGMPGARLAITAAQEPHERGGRRALATMCDGVGQGIAMAPERV